MSANNIYVNIYNYSKVPRAPFFMELDKSGSNLFELLL